MSPLLQLSEVTVEYHETEKRHTKAVDSVSLDIYGGGHTLGLVGESGSGKTSLGMSIMNAIEPPGRITSGRIVFEGTNVLEMSDKRLMSYRWKEVSFVYQSAMNSLNPVKKISDHIIEVLREHNGISKREAQEKTLRLLQEVGINTRRARDYPHEFSGGMRQRIVIAMALALSPKLLIADEPTSALDVVTQKQILHLMKREVSQRGLSLIFITHEIAILKGIVDNVAVMFRGEIVEEGPLREVLSRPLHPYTEMLLSSLLAFGSKFQPSSIDLETLAIPQIGCKYANRCKYVFSKCRSERPSLYEVKEERFVACHKYS